MFSVRAEHPDEMDWHWQAQCCGLNVIPLSHYQMLLLALRCNQKIGFLNDNFVKIIIISVDCEANVSGFGVPVWRPTTNDEMDLGLWKIVADLSG